MLRRFINRQQRGLLFKDGEYRRLLLPGHHWIPPLHSLKVYDALQPFVAPMDLNLLLEDAALADQLDVIEVHNNEIALVFEDDLCSRLLTPGRYAFWKGIKKRSVRLFDRSQPRIPDDVDRHVLRLPHVLEHTQVMSISAFEKGALFLDRRFVEILNPGDHAFWKSAVAVEASKIDMRPQLREITGQEILTKDRVGIRINIAFQYRVIDAKTVLLDVKEPDTQLHVLFQLAFREYVGNLTLDEILLKKEEIGPFVLERVRPSLQRLGLEGIQAGVKDIILPGEIRDILNQVLIAEKRAQANVIMRREETASTRNLLNTARLMEENPLLLRLKELEFMERLTEKVKEINVSGGDRILDQLKTLLLGKGQ